MPARAFFALIKEGRRIDLINKIESCDIAAITICSAEWYKEVRGGFAARLNDLIQGDEQFGKPEQLEPKPLSFANEPLKGEDAKQAVFNVFSMAKRFT